MKYNRQQIMKAAWNMFNRSKTWIEKYRLSFAECLRRAWKDAKDEVKNAESIKHEIGKSINRVTVWMRPSVIAESGRMGWILTGNTYKAKQIIKSMGFKWDIEAKGWYTENRDVAIRFANI